ncbi:hypothetical protein MHYP_G00012020 [Metynnis hypsauchen]
MECNIPKSVPDRRSAALSVRSSRSVRSPELIMRLRSQRCCCCSVRLRVGVLVLVGATVGVDYEFRMGVVFYSYRYSCVEYEDGEKRSEAALQSFRKWRKWSGAVCGSGAGGQQRAITRTHCHSMWRLLEMRGAFHQPQKSRAPEEETALKPSMASKLNPNVLYVREPQGGGGGDAGDESSDSDGEQEETCHKLIRKVSTSGQIRAKKSVKEGLLLKQTSSFQRWKRRYFKLRGRTLYYAKDSKSLIFDEVDLSDASVAETSTKNINNSFTVITPFRKLMLCAESRKEMEDWISALKSVQKWETYEASQFNMEHFSGMHNWYACSHARPTFCNVCREALPGVTSHGLSCEVCKFKAHKRCAVRSTNNCKWTTLASIGNDIIEDEDGVSMPHQWLEGNLPVSAKCVVCDRTCGSVRRLQDWRCLWCKAIVHSSCREQLGKTCPLGQCKVSIIPPTALNSIDSDGFWKATSPSCSSPLLVLVNSKSGDNQGVKFLRKFKQLLNPAQVFDLMNGGPQLG